MTSAGNNQTSTSLSHFLFILVAFLFSSYAHAHDSNTLELSGFSLMDDDLGGVIHKFGGNIIEKKTPDTYTVFACYILPKEKLMVRFMSGEQGLGKQLLQGFELAYYDADAPPDCSVLSPYRAFHLKPSIGPFRIGMGKKDYDKAITKLSFQAFSTKNTAGKLTTKNRQGRPLKTIFDADFVAMKLTRIKLWTSIDTN